MVFYIVHYYCNHINIDTSSKYSSLDHKYIKSNIYYNRKRCTKEAFTSFKIGNKMMMENNPNKLLGSLFIIIGLIGILISAFLIIGTIVLISKHYGITFISSLVETMLTICSTTTLGVGLIIFKYGEFP